MFYRQKNLIYSTVYRSPGDYETESCCTVVAAKQATSSGDELGTNQQAQLLGQ